MVRPSFISARTASVRRGHTLLELVAAGFVMAGVLVPALTLMQRSMDLSRKIDTVSMLNTLCVSKLEQHLALGAATFTSTTAAGDFGADGYPQLRFAVQRSDDPVDGGITDELMVVVATVWDDVDGNGSQGAAEQAITYSSKIAKMVVYENEASGT